MEGGDAVGERASDNCSIVERECCGQGVEQAAWGCKVECGGQSAWDGAEQTKQRERRIRFITLEDVVHDLQTRSASDQVVEGRVHAPIQPLLSSPADAPRAPFAPEKSWRGRDGVHKGHRKPSYVVKPV